MRKLLFATALLSATVTSANAQATPEEVSAQFGACAAAITAAGAAAGLTAGAATIPAAAFVLFTCVVVGPQVGVQVYNSGR